MHATSSVPAGQSLPSRSVVQAADRIERAYETISSVSTELPALAELRRQERSKILDSVPLIPSEGLTRAEQGVARLDPHLQGAVGDAHAASSLLQQASRAYRDQGLEWPDLESAVSASRAVVYQAQEVRERISKLELDARLNGANNLLDALGAQHERLQQLATIL